MSSRASTSSLFESNDEDTIIHRKLVFDSSMEESYINLMQKLIVKWVLTDYKSVEESEIMYNKILYQLSRIYLFRKKSEEIRKCIKEETKFFSAVEKTMHDKIVSVTDDISNTERLLKDAKKENKRSDKLDELVAEVSKYPPIKSLKLKKKQEETEMKEITETFDKVVRLRQKMDNQIYDLNREFRKCAKEIEQLKK